MTEQSKQDGDVPVHLRVPAATKARWVRESRAAGLRLSDWIVQKVEQAPGHDRALQTFTAEPPKSSAK